MAEIEFENDSTGAQEKMKGSDGRANVSSRADGRPYYNSRDNTEVYTWSFDHQVVADDEYSFYLQNTNSNSQDLVISFADVYSSATTRQKLFFVTGTAADGGAVTGENANHNTNTAAANARESAAATSISGLTEDGLIRFFGILAGGGREINLNDTVRLGQNEAIGLKTVEGGGAGVDVWGSVEGYFE